MELSVIFVYFGRRCWCHWTLTSQGEERQAAESKPGFLRLKVAVICVHGSWAQLQPGCVQGRARGPQPLGDMIKMQAELPFLWLCPLALSSLQGGKKFWGKKKPFLKDRSGLNANLRQLLMGNNNIKDLLSLPAPPPPPLKEL